ncbi:ribosomal RNA small subunit methyltransferase G [Spirochaetia bacterium]|nr:ribosomal RNA small subunit methyltransferase G [Spirochaetia bacterium]
MDILSEGLTRLCLTDRDTARLIEPRFSVITEKLRFYMDEIERFNPAYGLVKTANREELTIKHILDCLTPLGHISRLLETAGCCGDSAKVRAAPAARLADAGSGAGLPGIPLAICLPGTSITLIERMGRRAGFLRNVLAVLGLSNCTLAETELEKMAAGSAGTKTAPGFEVITFRAFHPLDPALLEQFRQLLVPGAFLAAYKGRKEKTEAELLSVSGAAGHWQLIPLTVPFLNEERHLAVFFQKTPATDPAIPHVKILPKGTNSSR